MASKIKVDQIEGSAGSTITIPTGQTFTITDGLASSSLPTVPVSKGGTGLTSLGTANQVLGVNSGASALEFQNVSSDWVKLASTQVTSGVAQVDFNSTVMTSDYKYFELNCRNVSGSGSDIDLEVKISVDNGSNFLVCFSGLEYNQLNGSSRGWNNYPDRHRLFEDANTSGSSVNYAQFKLFQSEGGTNYNGSVGWGVTRHGNNGNYYGYTSMAYWLGSGGAINFIRVLDGSGNNIDDGTFDLYGVK